MASGATCYFLDLREEGERGGREGGREGREGRRRREGGFPHYFWLCACVAAEFWALLHSGSGPGVA